MLRRLALALLAASLVAPAAASADDVLALSAETSDLDADGGVAAWRGDDDRVVVRVGTGAPKVTKVRLPAVPAGDLDRDGLADVLVSAAGAGGAYVVFGRRAREAIFDLAALGAGDGFLVRDVAATGRTPVRPLGSVVGPASPQTGPHSAGVLLGNGRRDARLVRDDFAISAVARLRGGAIELRVRCPVQQRSGCRGDARVARTRWCAARPGSFSLPPGVTGRVRLSDAQVRRRRCVLRAVAQVGGPSPASAVRRVTVRRRSTARRSRADH